MVQAVFLAFRRRLTPAEGIRFAQTLPAMARALFVAGWDPAQAVVPFVDPAALTREVQAVRQHHNFAPDSCIADVAAAVRACVDEQAFERCLADLPVEACAFWSVPA